MPHSTPRTRGVLRLLRALLPVVLACTCNAIGHPRSQLGSASDSESRPNWIGGERDPDQYTPLASCIHHRRIVDSSLLIYPASSPYSNTSVSIPRPILRLRTPHNLTKVFFQIPPTTTTRIMVGILSSVVKSVKGERSARKRAEEREARPPVQHRKSWMQSLNNLVR